MSKANSENGRKNVSQRSDHHVAAQDPVPGAKDRPGFDLGGSVTDKSAGTGLGLGEDAAEDARDRRLPRK